MRIIVTHSKIPINVEKIYSVDLTIGTIKDKLYAISGTTPDDMKLQLQDKNGKPICDMLDESKTLKDFNVQEYFIIHIIDVDETNSSKGYVDVSQVKKFEISEEKYNERQNSFRKWKKKNVVKKKKKKKSQKIPEKYLKVPKNMKKGDRCEWQNPTKTRGVISFIGETRSESKLGDGIWIGITLDEPYGKYNGSLKGIKYFVCEKKYGIFVRFDQIKVGDYPEESFDTDEEDEI